jgi:hypothetical protein
MDYDKVVGRVENMIYHISGCNFEEAKIVLEKCLEKNEAKRRVFKK